MLSRTFRHPQCWWLWFKRVELKNEVLVDEIINVVASFPTLEDVTAKVHKFKDDGGLLIIFDDMITQLSIDFERIFVTFTIIYNFDGTKPVFQRQKIYQNISLNAHYFVLMKNDRGKQRISTLAKQICSGNSRYIISTYEECRLYWKMIIKSFVDLLRIIQKLKSNEFGKLVNYLDDRSVDICI